MAVVGLDGVILGYRRGLKRQYTNYVYLKFRNFHSKSSASRLIGRKVVWRSSGGLKVIGSILKTHGNKGVVIARFRRPLPGQAIGSRVFLIG
ncbi:MAG: 50S ribosomal protein L35ae [Candidatus Methanomethylicota archaeon]|nr:50S ribosomal protein L35ae [Candidatus Culexmicrobium cathedralense]RLE48958.1 MAG: 50S ribosomal protein L35ae [Candidatus Verstraetearchaeota archaeon]